MERKTTQFILWLLITCGGLVSCEQAKDAVIEGLLQKEAKSFNKTGGKMIDQLTRLDSLSVQPGRWLLYHYTVTEYDNTDVDSAVLKRKIKPLARKVIAGNKELELLRKNEVSFKYIYYDKNHEYWFSLDITPSDYKPKGK